MELFEYASYGDYVDAQVEANSRKLSRVWVNRESVAMIRERIRSAERILCHGTRNGAELRYFEQAYPGAVVCGTEISPTAAQFEGTVWHDFHEPLPGWEGNADIVYSNSIDHAYRPGRALTRWRSQLAPRGVLCLEVAWISRAKASDPCRLERNDVDSLWRGNHLDLIDSVESAHRATLYFLHRKR